MSIPFLTNPKRNNPGKVPNTPTRAEKAVMDRMAKEKRVRAAAGGRASTNKTGPDGIREGAVGVKTLLGE